MQGTRGKHVETCAMGENINGRTTEQVCRSKIVPKPRWLDRRTTSASLAALFSTCVNHVLICCHSLLLSQQCWNLEQVCVRISCS